MSSRVQDRSRKFNKSNNKSSWNRTFTNDKAPTNEEVDEHSECIICAEKIEYAAKSPCNHTTCHKCTFRQRALYEKKACLICRTENDKLIFTELLDQSYSSFDSSSFVKFDEKLGIEFTSQYAYDDTMKLLEYKCQLCDVIEKDFKALGTHLKSEHERLICNICATNKKSFPSELKIYTQKQLQTHQTKGDEFGFNGHPVCPFCKGQRFYSDDELKIHLRQHHERCHVCDRINPSDPQYFKNYIALEEHFKLDHFICNVQVCLDKKFVVFEDELDLQAHMLQEHGGIQGKNYVVGATNNNRYHSQLSTFRPINNTSRSNSNNNNSNSTTNNSNESDVKKMRFEERARHYLNYSTNFFQTFQNLNNSYKNGKIDVSALLDSYTKLFKENSEDEIHLLIYDLSELYPKNSPQSIELSAIVKKHERKIQEENDFPALAGSSSSLNFGSNTWGSTSNKKKTQKQRLEEQFPALPSQPSKPAYSPVNTTVRYKSVVLQRKSKSNVVVNNSKSTYVPNYLSSPSSSSSLSSSSSNKINKDLFPELPVTSSSKPSVKTVKPVQTVKQTAQSTNINNELFPELPKSTKKVIPRVNPVPQGNGSWDLGSAASTPNSSSLNLQSLNDSLPVTKGKGKKKKQILFQIGR